MPQDFCVPRNPTGAGRRAGGVVRIKLDDQGLADSSTAGTTGTAAICIDHVRPTHVIRKVLLRQVAILNYVNPF